MVLDADGDVWTWHPGDLLWTCEGQGIQVCTEALLEFGPLVVL